MSQTALVTAIGELIADLPRAGIRLYDSNACYSALEAAKEAARKGDFFGCDLLLFRAGIEGVDTDDLRDAALLLEESDWAVEAAS
jgi:hypothetical protein